MQHVVQARRRPPKLDGRADRPRPALPPPATPDAGPRPTDGALIGLKHLF